MHIPPPKLQMPTHYKNGMSVTHCLGNICIILYKRNMKWRHPQYKINTIIIEWSTDKNKREHNVTNALNNSLDTYTYLSNIHPERYNITLNKKKHERKYNMSHNTLEFDPNNRLQKNYMINNFLFRNKTEAHNRGTN